MQLFTDHIDNEALSNLEGLKQAVTKLEAPYDILTQKLEAAKRAMSGSCTYRGEQFDGYGYDYDGLSATFKNIHGELIEQHREAFLVMNNKDREYLAAKDKLIKDVGDKIALAYKAKAEELGELHSLLYGVIHNTTLATTAQQFRLINVPSCTHYGNLANTTPRPHGQNAILHEGLAIKNGNEISKQVREFIREY